MKTVLEINLQSLEYNFNKIKSLVKPTTKTMAVVKANGYGSDMIAVAKKLNKLGVDYFSVAYASEGVRLRNAGIKTPILVLIPQTGSFDEITSFNLEPSIYSFHFLSKFIAYAHEKNILDYPIHFKINSGLNRIGFKESDIEITIVDPKVDRKKALEEMSLEILEKIPENKKRLNFTL